MIPGAFGFLSPEQQASVKIAYDRLSRDLARSRRPYWDWTFKLAYFFLHIAQNPKPWTYLYGTLIATACSYLMYRLGVDRVPSWGSLVKGAFDCFLPKLASQMGYKIDTDRSSFWLAVSQQLRYWNPISNNFSTQGSLADAKSKEVEEQSEGSEFDVEDDNDADDDDSDNTDDDDGEEDDLKG